MLVGSSKQAYEIVLQLEATARQRWLVLRHIVVLSSYLNVLTLPRPLYRSTVQKRTANRSIINNNLYYLYL